MQLVDTHCHLSDMTPERITEVLQKAHENEVTRMICIGAGVSKNDPQASIALSEKHHEIYCSVGVHPHDADPSVDISKLESFAAHPRVVAIGETGLDFFRDWSCFEQQRRIFLDSIALAINLKKPLVIHCRKAASETIALLTKANAKIVGGVFHCYGGNAEMAKELAEIGFCVSFTGVITFSKAESVRQAAKLIPLSQIMLETDTPYMAPVPYRGKPSEPMHVRQIAEKLALIKRIPVEEIAQQTTANAKRLFNIAV